MSDFYEVITPPVGVPVSFDNASDWCRDIDAADTEIVNMLIAAAVEYCEDFTNRVFVERTYAGKYSGVCLSIYEPYPFAELRRAPLISVDEVQVNGVVLDAADYIVKESSSFSRVLFSSLPTLDNDDTAYPIEITFQAGYGDKDTQPDWVSTVLKQMTLFWYENRGDVSTDKKQLIPFVAKAILKQNRIINTYG